MHAPSCLLFIGRLSVTEDYNGEQCQCAAKAHISPKLDLDNDGLTD